MKKTIKKSSSNPLPKLKNKLWEVFSEFIRKRDILKDGTFVCISCGGRQSASGGNLQAGHFHKSQMSFSLRYDEKNVNGQCLSCNIFKEGNRQGYEKGLIKKYGPEVIQLLDLRKNNFTKYDRFTYEILIKEYKEKLNQFAA